MDPDEGFAILRRLSSSHNRKLRDLSVLGVKAVSVREGTDQGSSASPSEQVRRALEGARGPGSEQRG